MRQVEWLNSNTYRCYPFVENQKLDFVGGGELFNSVIVDFQATNFQHDWNGLHMTQVIISSGPPRTGEFVFQYDLGYSFSFLVPDSAVIPYRAVHYAAAIQHAVCVFGSGLYDFLQLSAGTYQFTIHPQIEPALVGFQARHRIETITGSGPGSMPIGGRVYLEEGHNSQVGINYDLNELRISAIRGAGQGVDCARLTPDIVLCSESLLRINGMHGSDSGDFVIEGDAGVEVVPDPANYQVIIRRKASNIQNCG